MKLFPGMDSHYVPAGKHFLCTVQRADIVEMCASNEWNHKNRSLTGKVTKSYGYSVRQYI